MGGMGNEYILVRKPERERLFGRHTDVRIILK
jgi:hypothetical protein